jgi:hypothetical protein
MRYPDAAIPAGFAWSSPFARWQGSLAGLPGLAGRVGMPGVSGPMISQACATSVAGLHAAASATQADGGSLQLLVAVDRTSNGTQLIYPSPSALGGAPLSFNWVIDSFGARSVGRYRHARGGRCRRRPPDRFPTSP